MKYRRGAVHGKSAYMEFIDDEILHGKERRTHIFPVKIILYDACFIMLAPGGGTSPGALAGDRLGIWVKEIFIFIKDQPLFRIIGTVYPVGIFEFFYVQFEYNHGVNLPDPVMRRKWQHCKWFTLFSVEQEKFNGSCTVGVYGKVYAARNGCCAIGLVKSRADGKAAYIVHRDKVYGTREI